MNQIKQKIINFIKSVYCILNRDIKLQMRNLSDIASIIFFFIIIILIFIFSIGPDEKQLSIIGASILWSVLILSTSISINKSLVDDYRDGNFFVYQFAGFSFELVSIIKILTSWILYQLPLLLIVPIMSLILNISQEKIFVLMITMAIGSPILSILTIIATAMMLTNRRNLTLGSLVILPLSIPIIIFAMGAINSDVEIFLPQVYILISMLLFFAAIGPWIASACIKISLKN